MLARVGAASDAERELELADASLAALDVDGLVAHLSAAIRGFTAAGKPRRAAIACARLGDAYANFMGNHTAARAWFARATRLVHDEPPCLEQGWVAVAAMGCDVDDPAELLTRAELALNLARRFGDVNLETKALADAGLAHVQAGRLAVGMALLDEAMALACGQADDLDAAGKSVCSFFTACYFAADFERAGSWAEVLRQHGLIGLEPISPMFLSSHCNSVQATSLCELGRWGEAEALLSRSIADFERMLQVPDWHAAIVLADLRIRQGRLADAETLLLGKDFAMQALGPTARLHLSRGDYELARAAARRGLRVMGDDRLRASELLDVLIEAELAVGNIDAATKASEELEARAGVVEMPTLRARATVSRSRVLAASGDTKGAIAALEEAVDLLDPRTTPWLRALLLIEMARLREQAGDRAEAIVDAKAAATALVTLDVVLAPRDAELLERLTAGPAAATQTASLTHEARWWTVSFGGTAARLANTKGLHYLAALIARPGIEQHALDLVDRVEGVGDIDRRTLGDAGEVLDAPARAAYRHRIEELRSEIDDTLAATDFDRADALQAELDQLVAQLSQAFGLGGRDRRASSAAERARLNVTRALRAATVKLAEALPGAGDALDRHIRTGLYCVYEPAEGDEIRWIVQS